MQGAYLSSYSAREARPGVRPIRSVSPQVHIEKMAGEVVYLIDEDYRIRETVSEFLQACGIQIRCFVSARHYLGYTRSDDASCLILDLQLPDINGLELQRQLAGKGSPPIIFISGLADIRSSVAAMKGGAIEFLLKPVDPETLRISIQTAFARDRAQRKKQAEAALLHERYTRLTPREREVLPLVVSGLLNKQAASLLGISEITLQIHRSQVMRKMEADSLADLVRMAIRLRLPEWRSDHVNRWTMNRNAAALAR